MTVDITKKPLAVSVSDADHVLVVQNGALVQAPRPLVAPGGSLTINGTAITNLTTGSNITVAGGVISATGGGGSITAGGAAATSIVAADSSIAVTNSGGAAQLSVPGLHFTDLPAASAPSASDVLLLSQSGTVSQATWQLLLNAILALVPSSGGGTSTETVASQTISRMRTQAAVSRYNNPHINPVSSTPPAFTLSATAPASPFALYTSWGGTNQDAVNYYGGAALNSSAPRVWNAVTISGALACEGWRIQATVDSAKFYIAIGDNGTSAAWRLIVNGQYVSLTPVSNGVTGNQFLCVDFTGVGGRAVRDIILEAPSRQARYFGIYVLPTEGVYKPAGPVLRAAVVGDSFTATGAGYVWDCFGNVLCDMLGLRDYWNLGVPGCGLIANGSGAQTTALQRLSDLTAAAPNVVFVANGHDDNVSSPSAVQTAMASYLAAIRGATATAQVPIFVLGVLSGNVNADGTMAATETAIAAAVTAFADPAVFFIPVTTDATGRWMTGSGSTAAPAANGNSDVYIGADAVHPTAAGHYFLGDRFFAAISRTLASVGTIVSAGVTTAPTIAISNITPLTAGGTSTITGTFANGAPASLTALDDGSSIALSGIAITTTSGTGATAAGTFTATFTAPAAGNHSMIVSGTGTYAATSAPGYAFTTSAAPAATIAITNLSPNPATAGSTVTLTGTFSNGAPTGSSVSYAIDGGSAVAITGPSVITNSGSGATAAGSITGTFAAPAAGSHTVVLSATTSGAAVTSSGASLTTRAAPSAPTITLTPGNNQISIAYTDGAANGAAITGRSLYRSTTAGAETLVTSGITSSPVVDASVTNGTTYYYRLSATNAVGEGAKSAEVSAAPTAGTGTVGNGSRALVLGSGSITAPAAPAYNTTLSSGASTVEIIARIGQNTTGAHAGIFSDGSTGFAAYVDNSDNQFDYYCPVGSSSFAGSGIIVTADKTWVRMVVSNGNVTTYSGSGSALSTVTWTQTNSTNFNPSNGPSNAGGGAMGLNYPRIEFFQISVNGTVQHSVDFSNAPAGTNTTIADSVSGSWVLAGGAAIA